jgi:hypothetical protein
VRPDTSQWKQTIDDEITSCLEFDVWEAADLPEGKQALPSRFVLDRKRDGRYKARLVAWDIASNRISALVRHLPLFVLTAQCACCLLWRLGKPGAASV